LYDFIAQHVECTSDSLLETPSETEMQGNDDNTGGDNSKSEFYGRLSRKGIRNSSTRIHIGNLSFNTTEDELRSMFGIWGNVKVVDLPTIEVEVNNMEKNKRKNRRKIGIRKNFKKDDAIRNNGERENSVKETKVLKTGYGFVEFETVEDQQRALIGAATGGALVLRGRVLKISPAQDKYV
jgi:RNA recognition motif-containing protein